MSAKGVSLQLKSNKPQNRVSKDSHSYLIKFKSDHINLELNQHVFRKYCFLAYIPYIYNPQCRQKPFFLKLFNHRNLPISFHYFLTESFYRNSLISTVSSDFPGRCKRISFKKKEMRRESLRNFYIKAICSFLGSKLFLNWIITETFNKLYNIFGRSSIATSAHSVQGTYDRFLTTTVFVTSAGAFS